MLKIIIEKCYKYYISLVDIFKRKDVVIKEETWIENDFDMTGLACVYDK